MSTEDYNDRSVDAVLARMEERQKANSEKLDTVILSHRARMEKQDSKIEQHAERIGSLEKWRWYLAGAGGALLLLWENVRDFFTGKH